MTRRQMLTALFGAAVLLCILLWIWLHPLAKRHKERRAAKKLHAIV